MATENEILDSLDKIAHRIKSLLETKAMVRGSFGTVYRRCGKPNCWCAAPKEKGHACTRISWTENGNSHTLSINEEKRELMQNLVESYREYRKNRRLLRLQEKDLEILLDKHENYILERSIK
jgi:hypothetical protein